MVKRFQLVYFYFNLPKEVWEVKKTLFIQRTLTMSEQNISDLIETNARLTASNEKLTNSVAELTKTQAWMTADKENMENGELEEEW